MTWKKMAVIGIPAIALALGASGGAQANLVTNGDFELTNNPFVPPDKQPITVPAPTGWNFGPIISGPYAGLNSVTFLCSPGTADNTSYLIPVYAPFPYQSPAVGNFVQADGDSNYSGPISQTISETGDRTDVRGVLLAGGRTAIRILRYSPHDGAVAGHPRRHAR